MNDEDHRTHTIVPDENGLHILIHPANALSVGTVLSAPISDDGRSRWLWVRFPDGDLVLATFPRGDTYLAVEEDASWQGTFEPVWCESCGESPASVRTEDAALCCGCAAKAIDQLSAEVAAK